MSGMRLIENFLDLTCSPILLNVHDNELAVLGAQGDPSAHWRDANLTRVRGRVVLLGFVGSHDFEHSQIDHLHCLIPGSRNEFVSIPRDILARGDQAVMDRADFMHHLRVTDTPEPHSAISMA